MPKKIRKSKSVVSRASADLALLQKLMANAAGGMFDEPTPEVRAVPERAQGFRVRVDLMYAKPPIWRRLDLPGDLVLDELHVVLQVAMGWQDGHLHKFGVGADRRTRAYFVTGFDHGPIEAIRALRVARASAVKAATAAMNAIRSMLVTVSVEMKKYPLVAK